MLKPVEGAGQRSTAVVVVVAAAAFAGGSDFGGNVLGIMIGVALCLSIGGLSMVVLGMVVLGGTGIGGDERFGAINVPIALAAGDLAFDGNDGL